MNGSEGSHHPRTHSEQWSPNAHFALTGEALVVGSAMKEMRGALQRAGVVRGRVRNAGVGVNHRAVPIGAVLRDARGLLER